MCLMQTSLQDSWPTASNASVFAGPCFECEGTTVVHVVILGIPPALLLDQIIALAHMPRLSGHATSPCSQATWVNGLVNGSYHVVFACHISSQSPMKSACRYFSFDFILFHMSLPKSGAPKTAISIRFFGCPNHCNSRHPNIRDPCRFSCAPSLGLGLPTCHAPHSLPTQPAWCQRVEELGHQETSVNGPGRSVPVPN